MLGLFSNFVFVIVFVFVFVFVFVLVKGNAISLFVYIYYSQQWYDDVYWQSPIWYKFYPVFVFVFVFACVFVFVITWVSMDELAGIACCSCVRSSLKGLEQFGTLKPKCRPAGRIGWDIPDQLGF